LPWLTTTMPIMPIPSTTVPNEHVMLPRNSFASTLIQLLQ
jgi:hypothetical protein